MVDRTVTQFYAGVVGRNPEQNAAARERARARILESALELVAERGLAGTPMVAVAHRAGVSKALVFRYFETKEALGRALVQRRISELGRIAAGLPEGEPPARLRAFAVAMANEVERDPKGFTLHLRALLDPDLRALAGPLAPDRSGWVSLFATLGAHDPELEARFFQVALLGVLTHRVVSPTPVPIRPLVDRLLTAILERAEPCP